MTDDLITWLRQQLDEDEAWARAACQPYPYAADKTLPEGGVHWRWVAGDQWETVVPDPAVDEFVSEPGYPCHLATVEEWPARDGRMMPRTYDNEIVEMDPSAAGHIARHDPARVLAEVAAKRRILRAHDVHCDGHCEDARWDPHAAHWWSVKVLASVYAERPGYREEWRPA